MSFKLREMLYSADGNEGGASEQVEASTESGEQAASKDANGGGQTAGEDIKPFAVFPDEASFMGRVSREAKKQVEGLLKGLGLNNESELKSIIKQRQEQEEQSKTELQKLQEAAAKASQQRDEAMNRAAKALKTAEAKVQALSLGVKAERLDYVLKLIDLEGVDVEDGKVDKSAIKNSLEKVLKEFPELRQQQAAAKAGQDFNSPPKNNFLSLEVIKNMSVEEAERRMPEILEFLSKN